MATAFVRSAGTGIEGQAALDSVGRYKPDTVTFPSALKPMMKASPPAIPTMLVHVDGSGVRPTHGPYANPGVRLTSLPHVLTVPLARRARLWYGVAARATTLLNPDGTSV